MTKRDLSLWASVLGGPIVWLSSFEARFALAPWACTYRNKAALFGVAFVACCLCAASASLAWTQWRTLGSRGPTGDYGVTRRSNFMAIGGMVLSLACLLIVLAQSIPELLLGACE